MSLTTPKSVADITTGWLSARLREAGYESEVVGFDAIGVGHGLLGITQRLTLEYSEDSQRKSPHSLILKYASSNKRSRNTGKIGYGVEGRPGFFEQEVLFYRDFANSLDIDTPRCYYSWISEQGEEFTLLLEDISPASPGDEFQTRDPELIAGAMHELAGLHAAYWGTLEASNCEFLRPPTKEEARIYAGRLGRNVEVLAERGALNDDDEFRRLADVFAEGAETWFAGMGQATTVTHGDFRLDNMLFSSSEQGPRIVTVDWQTFSPASASRDLGMFLGASISTPVRREYQSKFLDVYHSRLVDLGVRDLSLDDVHEMLRIGMFHSVHNVLSLLRGVDSDSRGRDLAREWMRRSVATANDLNCWEIFK